MQLVVFQGLTPHGDWKHLSENSFKIMNIEKINITCADGVVLAARLVVPSSLPKAVVQINSATATPKEYYANFANYLAQNGFVVCYYDYRGICESQPLGGLKGCDYQYLDWPMLDMPAVLYYLDGRFENLPKLIVGHSVGGQKIGLMPNLNKIKGMFTFATSAGYWGNMPWAYRLQTHFFFEIVRPITHFLFGYTATKKLGLMEDLPKNITNTWRDWCSVPDYFFDERFLGKTVPKGYYNAIPFAIKVYWASDDPISNHKNITNFWKHIKSTQRIDIEELKPENFKVKSIGHFGFFRKTFKESLWPIALKDLETMC